MIALRSTTVKKSVTASPEAVYDAFVNAEAVAAWLPPGEMRGIVHEFDAREGGSFCMSLIYPPDDEGIHGKTEAKTDTFEGRFVRLVADREVVWATTFVSTDTAFAGEMTIRTTIAAADGGATVTITCDNIPPGIRLEDNAEGCRESLAKLAAYLDSKSSP